MVRHKNLVFHLLSRLFNISAFWNAFQNDFKWILKNLHCIHAKYEHFITHSQCQRHTNMNNIKQELLAYYEHLIDIYLTVCSCHVTYVFQRVNEEFHPAKSGYLTHWTNLHEDMHVIAVIYAYYVKQNMSRKAK